MCFCDIKTNKHSGCRAIIPQAKQMLPWSNLVIEENIVRRPHTTTSLLRGWTKSLLAMTHALTLSASVFHCSFDLRTRVLLGEWNSLGLWEENSAKSFLVINAASVSSSSCLMALGRRNWRQKNFPNWPVLQLILYFRTVLLGLEVFDSLYKALAFE